MRSQDMPVSAGHFALSGMSEPSALASQYVQLTQLHHDLDYMITALSFQPSHDELLVARLKKRKLRLKDEIARIEGGLHAPPPSVL